MAMLIQYQEHDEWDDHVEHAGCDDEQVELVPAHFDVLPEAHGKNLHNALRKEGDIKKDVYEVKAPADRRCVAPARAIDCEADNTKTNTSQDKLFEVGVEDDVCVEPSKGIVLHQTAARTITRQLGLPGRELGRFF